VSQDGERFGFAVFFLQALLVLQSLRIGSQKQDSSFGECPLQVDVSDLSAGAFEAFAGGLLDTLDQAGVGGEVLYPWEAVNVVDLVEDDEREDFSNAVDSAKEVESLRVMFPGARAGCSVPGPR